MSKRRFSSFPKKPIFGDVFYIEVIVKLLQVFQDNKWKVTMKDVNNITQNS